MKAGRFLHRSQVDAIGRLGQNAGKRKRRAMPEPVFTHRQNADGSFDSICSRCLEIAASAQQEGQLSSLELMHICDPIRLYQISQGRITPL
jgi:hypothetical protein